jgi:hypothetical protein
MSSVGLVIAKSREKPRQMIAEVLSYRFPSGNASLTCHGSPDQKYDDGSDRSADQASAFVCSIPTHCLTKIRGDESTNDSQNGGEDKTLWLVSSGGNQLCDNTGDKADKDSPQNAHVRLHGLKPNLNVKSKQSVPEPKRSYS